MRSPTARGGRGGVWRRVAVTVTGTSSVGRDGSLGRGQLLLPHRSSVVSGHCLHNRIGLAEPPSTRSQFQARRIKLPSGSHGLLRVLVLRLSLAGPRFGRVVAMRGPACHTDRVLPGAGAARPPNAAPRPAVPCSRPVRLGVRRVMGGVLFCGERLGVHPCCPAT